MPSKLLAALAALAVPCLILAAEAPMKMIEKSATVPAPASEVWKAWTTPEGVATFFAPKARLELRLGGPFEMLFAPDMPAGAQGSEGCKVLSFLPGRMLSFNWNAPPKFPAVRNGGEHTFVVVEIQSLGERKTQVTLTHLGWREGPEWDQVYAYFNRAWEVVLARLARRFENGPLDWANPWTPSETQKAQPGDNQAPKR